MLGEIHHAQERGLAGAARADQEMIGAGVELQGDSLQDFRPVSIAQHNLLEANKGAFYLFPVVQIDNDIAASIPLRELMEPCFAYTSSDLKSGGWGKSV